MIRAVADTNIYVSAYNFHGRPEEVLTLAQVGFFGLFVSPDIFNEFKRVNKLKMNWTNERIERTLFHIASYSELIYPSVELDVIKIDPSDNRILECAVAAKADFIITGDERHLLKLKEFQGIKIIRPGEFIKKELWN
jgi:putative PIN family toxin of toxin-antitoxin system